MSRGSRGIFPMLCVEYCLVTSALGYDFSRLPRCALGFTDIISATLTLNMIYLGLSLIFSLMISALLLDFIMIL